MSPLISTPSVVAVQRDVLGRVAVAADAAPVARRRCERRAAIQHAAERRGTCGTMLAVVVAARRGSCPRDSGSVRPCAAKKRAAPSPPKPVVAALLAMRAALKSVALIHRRHVPALAQPVRQADVVGVHVGDDHAQHRQAVELGARRSAPRRRASSSLAMQQSTMVQPSRPSMLVAQQPQVDVVQRERQRHAQPAHAGRDLERSRPARAARRPAGSRVRVRGRSSGRWTRLPFT